MPRLSPTAHIITQCNLYIIEAFHTYLGSHPQIEIIIRRGFRDDDGDDTWFDPPISHTISGTALAAELGAPTSGAPLYSELKNRLYARCVTDGIIPADAQDI